METEWKNIIRKRYFVDTEDADLIKTVGEDYSGSTTNDKSDPGMFLFVCIFEEGFMSVLGMGCAHLRALLRSTPAIKGHRVQGAKNL